MKVIFIANVQNIGEIGEIKEVKNGLARNFLIPKKLAVRATDANLKSWESRLQSAKYKNAKILEGAQSIAESLENVSLSFYMKAGEEGKLFGSVTSQHVSDQLKEKGFAIDKKDIILEDSIKSLGNFSVPIKLHAEVITNIFVDVIKEEEQEAEST